ncbi:hypothetical protein Pelo_16624 [Pelomyxa schiedti]|nr:hypothetical protein Pelo_16624 [Pelomyxa schiedti]
MSEVRIDVKRRSRMEPSEVGRKTAMSVQFENAFAISLLGELMQSYVSSCLDALLLPCWHFHISLNMLYLCCPYFTCLCELLFMLILVILLACYAEIVISMCTDSTFPSPIVLQFDFLQTTLTSSLPFFLLVHLQFLCPAMLVFFKQVTLNPDNSQGKMISTSGSYDNATPIPHPPSPIPHPSNLETLSHLTPHSCTQAHPGH